jgi:hypothetical protein
MFKKKKLTDDELDALVIADANDESAWGEPVIVRPSKSPRPAWIARAKHLDLAAVPLPAECLPGNEGLTPPVALDGRETGRRTLVPPKRHD